MKVLKVIYEDGKGRTWNFEKCSVPTTKGSYRFWIAECSEISKSFREEKKRDLIKRIKEIV